PSLLRGHRYSGGGHHGKRVAIDISGKRGAERRRGQLEQQRASEILSVIQVRGSEGQQKHTPLETRLSAVSCQLSAVSCQPGKGISRGFPWWKSGAPRAEVLRGRKCTSKLTADS